MFWTFFLKLVEPVSRTHVFRTLNSECWIGLKLLNIFWKLKISFTTQTLLSPSIQTTTKNQVFIHDTILISIWTLFTESWIELGNNSSGPRTPERVTPLPFQSGEEYLRLLREAQRESNQSSRVVSLASSRRDTPHDSPKSPPNSPNTELCNDDELKGVYINYWNKVSFDVMQTVRVISVGHFFVSSFINFNFISQWTMKTISL